MDRQRGFLSSLAFLRRTSSAVSVYSLAIHSPFGIVRLFSEERVGVKFTRERREEETMSCGHTSYLGRAMTFLIASRHYASYETPTQTHVIVMQTFIASLQPDHRKKECRIFLPPPSPVPTTNKSLSHLVSAEVIIFRNSEVTMYWAVFR